MKLDKDSIGQMTQNLTDKAGKAAKSLAAKGKQTISKSKDSVVSKIDLNGDGKVDIEDIITLGLKTPGIRIRRDDFLAKELIKTQPKEVIDKAIATTPAQAGISQEEIESIAENVIKYERLCVTGISTALGAPGGAAMAATIPADIIQYYGYMLRAAQKLMYLYGFPEIGINEETQGFDSETMNILIVCLGVMYGVVGANNAIKAIANAFAKGVEKKLLNTALTKGTLYPLVKSVAKWFGVKMTKDVFAGFFKKTIPVVGGVIGGGLTFVSFKPCCDKLKASLNDTLLSNPNHKADEKEELFINNGFIEVDYSEAEQDK
ncbi:MAG: hypothetical protein KHW70_02525 [Clostridium sp.]|jgi:hypothetical protein|nr:hypothetical protein [Clostridium sp.]